MTVLAGISAFFKTKAGKIFIIIAAGFLVFSAFMIMFAVKENALDRKQKEIEKQKEEIIRLELNNERLQNEIEFIKEQEKFQKSFSNSSIIIKNIDKELLTRKENEAFNNISNNFYKYFNSINFMQYKNKICENTSFCTSRNIYYKTCYKQAGFNEKLSREYYKNRRMAVMV